RADSGWAAGVWNSLTYHAVRASINRGRTAGNSPATVTHSRLAREGRILLLPLRFTNRLGAIEFHPWPHLEKRKSFVCSVSRLKAAANAKSIVDFASRKSIPACAMTDCGIATHVVSRATIRLWTSGDSAPISPDRKPNSARPQLFRSGPTNLPRTQPLLLTID